ncbi:MAG: hypothetical protein AAF798_10835 [Bacteroidota bacterium]
MKYNFIHIGLFLLSGLLSFPISTFAQTTVQVVTKRIEKTFNFKAGYELNIEGEKAKVDIQTWDQPQIKVVLEISAKHQDQAIAEQELEQVRYLTDRIKNKIYLRNYYAKEEGEGDPESILSANYQILVPEECPVYLKNYFGVANISDLTNRLRVSGEFASIGLQNVSGQVDVTTRFGDLTGNLLDGLFNINARRSDILLTDISGQYNIQAQYGTIEIFADEKLINLNLEAEKSDVYFYTNNPTAFAYDINTRFSNIDLPSHMKFDYNANNFELRKARFRPKQEVYSNIVLTITFGDLAVGKKRAAKP